MVMTFFSVSAQTNIYGTYDTDQTWTKSGHPYIIRAETVIEGTLIIEAGVQVEFESAGIEIQQNLFIRGNIGDSVYVISNNTSNLIKIHGDVNISYLSMSSEGSTRAISVLESDSFVVNNSVFFSGAIAVDVVAKYMRIDSTEFSNYGYPVSIGKVNDGIIKNCVFLDYQNGIGGGENTLIEGCDFLGKIDGPFSTGISGTPKIVRDCRFIGNLEGARVSGGAFINNVFEENKVAFKIEGFKENYGDIKSNSFCDNIEYDIYNDSFFDFTLDSNCFCGRLESEVNVFDFDDDPSKGKVDLGFMKADCKTYTCLPTDILEDLVLTKKDGPYKICDESFLYAGVTLTVEAGVDLLFAARLNVRGHFEALGAQGDTIFLDSEYPFPTNEAILIEGIGSVDINYAKTYGNTPTMLTLKSSSKSYISNVFFDGHKQAISGYSGQVNICSSRFEGGWGGINLIDMDSSVVSNCTFENQLTGIVSRNGKNIIKNCTVSNMERHGIMISGGVVLSHNKVENCLIAGVLIEGEVEIYNNAIIDNEVGILFSSSYNEQSVSVIDNRFCNGSENIKFEGFNGIDISDNCWCTDNVESTVSGGAYVLSGTRNLCNEGLENEVNCSYTFSNPDVGIGNEGLSISGSVYEGANKLISGVAFLYDGNGEGKEAIDVVEIINGDFKFINLNKGIYTILAGPKPGDVREYVPTFYAEKHNVEEAHYINLQGTIFGIDLKLNEKTDASLGSLTIPVLPEVGKVYYSPTEYSYPVLLLDNVCGSLEIIDWDFQYGSGVQFDKIKEGIYSITIPENGRINENHCLSVSGSLDYTRVEGECVCVGLEAGEITQTSFYPNPVTDYITIKNNEGVTTYSIRNLYGELLLEGNLYGDSPRINVSELDAGAYFIQLDALSMHSFIKLAE